MQKSKKSTGKITMFPSCCIGTGVGLVVTLAGSATGALFISNEYITLDTMGVLGFVIQLCSVLLGAVLACFIVEGNKFLCCTAVASVYFAILLGVAILFYNGPTSLIFGGLLACVTGCAAALFLSRRRKKRAVHKKIKSSSR